MREGQSGGQCPAQQGAGDGSGGQWRGAAVRGRGMCGLLPGRGAVPGRGGGSSVLCTEAVPGEPSVPDPPRTAAPPRPRTQPRTRGLGAGPSCGPCSALLAAPRSEPAAPRSALAAPWVCTSPPETPGSVGPCFHGHGGQGPAVRQDVPRRPPAAGAAGDAAGGRSGRCGRKSCCVCPPSNGCDPERGWGTGPCPSAWDTLSVPRSSGTATEQTPTAWKPAGRWERDPTPKQPAQGARLPGLASASARTLSTNCHPQASAEGTVTRGRAGPRQPQPQPAAAVLRSLAVPQGKNHLIRNK